MIKFVDNVLNRITMYRLMLYYLIFLLGMALVFSSVGLLGYDPFALLFTVGFLLGACSLANWVFAKTFGVPANAESTYISALILALIITPYQSPHDLWFLGWAAVLAMAGKYIVAINKKHLFNPVALAVALTYFVINQSASWWVGSGVMLPFVLIGGWLIVRKLDRSDLVSTFLVVVLAATLAISIFNGDNILAAFQTVILSSPLFFFAFVILTEPLTTPPTRGLRVVYASLVGVLFAPQFHIGGFYATPELAILIGNAFSYLVSPKTTLVLRFKQKIQIANDVYDFIFTPERKFAFAPGQYMEWTLGHNDPDSRGNRRYFTLASSPTENTMRLGVKFYPHASTFKQAMLSLNSNSEIAATHLAGDFVLPRNPNQKCVFIAGGIGVTPFRSMIKYLLDTHQRRPIVLFYANKQATDVTYVDVFEKAREQLGLKTIYTLTDTRNVPPWWKGQVGRITAQMIRNEVPDYGRCIFYISGPKEMIDAFKEMLKQLHISDSHIKTDFFSGFA